MAVRIEDAGFEIRDMIAWVYGSGFPKSLDVGKAIDKAAGVKFDAVPAAGVGFMNAAGDGGYNVTKNQLLRSGESTEAARQWQGWGTALKPALEPITVARKPLIGTVAANVLAHGTGALNIDGCRVGTESTLRIKKGGSNQFPHEDDAWVPKDVTAGSDIGRWPANLIHDGGVQVLAGFPETSSGGYPPEGGQRSQAATYGTPNERGEQKFTSSSGSAARFFYTAKASADDRDDGNSHPTVKPTDLMAYLIRLVTPPGGIVLDCFMGSGSTGKAAALGAFQFIGIERDPAYFDIARARITAASAQQHLFVI